MNLSEFQEMVEDQGAWCAAVHGVTNSWTRFRHWTTTMRRIHTVLNTTALQEGKDYREKQQHFLIYTIFLLFLPFPHLWKIGDTEKYFFTKETTPQASRRVAAVSSTWCQNLGSGEELSSLESRRPWMGSGWGALVPLSSCKKQAMWFQIFTLLRSSSKSGWNLSLKHQLK